MAPVPQSSGRAEGKASLLASVGVRQAWEMVFPIFPLAVCSVSVDALPGSVGVDFEHHCRAG